MNCKEYLTKIWYDPKSTVAFSGLYDLNKYILKDNKFKIGKKNIQAWLQDQDSYSVRRKVIRKVKTNKIIVKGINYMWDGDLMDVSNIKEDNEGITSLLIIIDVFSRYVFVKPLKNKTTLAVPAAFKQILNEYGFFPRILRTNRGSEFLNASFQKLCKDRNIISIDTTSNYEAAFAESFISKLKNILFRYFHSKLNYKYLKVLDDLIKAYNSRIHPSLYGFAPKDITEENQYEFFIRKYNKKKYRNKKKKIENKLKKDLKNLNKKN